ncbi:MAG: hypothetical protein KGM17_11780 [Sphingomonadales bacterium]|nr:hypothetical protein [Sphingomonadales bacterium]
MNFRGPSIAGAVAGGATPALVQAGLAALVLAACLLVPRTGGAVLLLPLDGRPMARARLAGIDGLALVGSARIPGSLIVHAPRGVPFWTLLRRGIVPVTAPERLCSPLLVKD